MSVKLSDIYQNLYNVTLTFFRSFNLQPRGQDNEGGRRRDHEADLGNGGRGRDEVLEVIVVGHLGVGD